MRYLVTMEAIEATIPRGDPARLLRHVEDVIASHEAMMKLEAQGKVLGGGGQAGKRAEAFVAEVASHDELDQLLRELPNWINLTVNVIPLISYKDIVAGERQLLEGLKAASQ